MPNSSRPPQTEPTVAAILASPAGGRNRLLVTITPIRSRSVWTASADNSVHASKLGPTVAVAAERHEVVEQSSLFDLRDAVRLASDP